MAPPVLALRYCPTALSPRGLRPLVQRLMGGGGRTEAPPPDPKSTPTGHPMNIKTETSSGPKRHRWLSWFGFLLLA